MDSCWTALGALVAANVLQESPVTPELQRAATSLLASASPGTSSSSSSSSTASTIPTLALHDAVEAAVAATPRLRPVAAAASLFCSSLTAERLCRERSTRAAIARWGGGNDATASPALPLSGSGVAAPASSGGSGSGGTVGGSGGNAVAGGSAADAAARARYAGYGALTSPGALAARLLQLLGEPESQIKFFTKMAAELTPAGVVEVLVRVDRAGGMQVADGSGQRTPGGCFIAECKRYKAGARQAAVAAQPPPLPALRPYQRDVVGAVLFSWGVRPTAEVLAPAGAGTVGGGSGGTAGGAVGSAQQAAMRCWSDKAGGWSGNWLVAAPTGSGKTRMFVEVTRAVVAHTVHTHCRGAVVVVLVPRVLLTTQQGDVFVASGLPATDTFYGNSDSQLSVEVWRRAVSSSAAGRSCVLVCTPDSFLNLLLAAGRTGEERPEERVDLVILDEAHHCHDDHAYAKIASALVVQPAAAAAIRRRGSGRVGPRVLGVTASPAGDEDEHELKLKMTALLSCLDAELLVVSEDDDAVAAVLAQPDRRELRVRVRPVDLQLAALLRARIVEVALDIGESLKDAPVVGAAVSARRMRLLQDLYTATGALEDGALSGDSGSANSLASRLGKWLADTWSFAADFRCPQLELCCHLLDVMRKAEELVADAGFEGVLPFLARKGAALCLQETNSGGGGAAPAMTANDSCGDIALRASELVAGLLVDSRTSVLQAGAGRQSAAEAVRQCFMSGTLQEDRTFPKFWALLDYLQLYRSRQTFHGIVFVKTRQAVFHVSDMMRRTQQLGFVEVLELIGHNTSRRRSTLAPEQDRHGRGMSDTEQQQVLRMFKAPGRKVLVATSAAEEGLDVPSCEFVVRYNAAATGIQLLQSRGRARMRVSEFVAILQDGTLDVRHHARSQVQVANMHEYLRNHRDGRGAT